MGQKIAVFSLAYRPVVGGAEIAIEEIAKRLPGRQFVVFTMRFDATSPASERVGNVEVVRLCPAWLPLPLRKVAYPFLAARAAKARAGEFVSIWGMMAAHAGLAASWLKRCFPEKPFLLTLQEGISLEEIRRKGRLAGPFFRGIFARADAIQCISNFLAAFAREQAPGTRVVVVPNGVDLAAFGAVVRVAPTPGRVTLFTSSRLVPKNGVDRVIAALPLLPEARFVVCGVGPDERALRDQAARLGVADRVASRGFASHAEVAAALGEADVFVRLSRSEGMGNSFVEAMAAGVPVIGTLVGGIPDFLRDGETGLAVPGDDPAAFAAAVRRLAGDPELRGRLVANARQLAAERFDWAAVARQMDELFASL